MPIDGKINPPLLDRLWPFHQDARDGMRPAAPRNASGSSPDAPQHFVGAFGGFDCQDVAIADDDALGDIEGADGVGDGRRPS